MGFSWPKAKHWQGCALSGGSWGESVPVSFSSPHSLARGALRHLQSQQRDIFQCLSDSDPLASLLQGVGMVSLALPRIYLPSCFPQGPGCGQHSPSGLGQPRKGQERYLQGPFCVPAAGPGAKGLTQQEMLKLHGALWDGSSPGRKSKQLHREMDSTSSELRGERCGPASRETGSRDHWVLRAALSATTSQPELRLVVSVAQPAKPTRKRQPRGLQQTAVGSDRPSSRPATYQHYEILGKPLRLSKPHFLIYKTGIINNPHLLGLW